MSSRKKDIVRISTCLAERLVDIFQILTTHIVYLWLTKYVPGTTTQHYHPLPSLFPVVCDFFYDPPRHSCSGHKCSDYALTVCFHTCTLLVFRIHRGPYLVLIVRVLSIFQYRIRFQQCLLHLRGLSILRRCTMRMFSRADLGFYLAVG